MPALTRNNGDLPTAVTASRYKTKVCQKFADTGSCPYEARCMFAHGLQEMRTKEMNLTDGLLTDEAIRGHQRKLKIEAAAAAASVAHKQHNLQVLQTQQLQEQQQQQQSTSQQNNQVQQGNQQHQPPPQQQQQQQQQQQMPVAPQVYYQQQQPQQFSNSTQPQPQLLRSPQLQPQVQQQQQQQQQQRPEEVFILAPSTLQSAQPVSNHNSMILNAQQNNSGGLNPLGIPALNSMFVPSASLCSPPSPLRSPQTSSLGGSTLSNQYHTQQPGGGPVTPITVNISCPALNTSHTRSISTPNGAGNSISRNGSLSGFPVIPVDDLPATADSDEVDSLFPDDGSVKASPSTTGALLLTPGNASLSVPANLSFNTNDCQCPDCTGGKVTVVVKRRAGNMSINSQSLDVPASETFTPLDGSVTSMGSGYSPSQRQLHDQQHSTLHRAPCKKQNLEGQKHKPLLKTAAQRAQASSAHSPYASWQYNPVCSCTDCMSMQ